MLDTIWTQLVATSWIEWLGTVTGVTGVYLSIKEKTVAWVLFIICYSCYVFLSIQADLFAALMMNAVFIFISIYGWISWSKAKHSTEPGRAISRAPKVHLVPVGGFIIAGTFGFGWALNHYTEAFLPYVDAFAMCSAFTAQWMLSRKYLENWLFWTIANTIYIGLWAAQGYYVTVGLFSIFIFLALKGWIEWRGIIKSNTRD
jgi:nicotinamide mononucleotide transporter